MKNFKSICFIYQKKESYLTCYLKEFFKWIGFSYYAYLYDPNKENEFIDNLADSEFDIYVTLDTTMQEGHREKIAKKENCVFEEMTFQEDVDEKKSLKKLLEKFQSTLLNKYNTTLLFDLYSIYERNNFAAVLYEYTFTLLRANTDFSKDFYHQVCETYETVWNELESLEVNYGDEITGKGHDAFIEYYLYAKFHCMKKTNDLRDMRKRAAAFDVDQYIKDVDKIYLYDKDFFKVEYLKATILELDPMKTVHARKYFEKCTIGCRIEVCKSFYYYRLGKWMDKNRQPYEAGKAYLVAYRKATDNLKAVFKLAFDYERKQEIDIAKKYYMQMTKLWAEAENPVRIPLMELEYAYKAYKLLDRITEGRISEYNEKAADILQFVENLWREKTPDTFMFRLYNRSGIKLQDISRLIKMRMDIKCKELEIK